MHQRHRQPFLVESERFERAFDAGDIAMMIGAPDVDDEIEAALEFIQMIGDVRGKIRILAVLALDNAVLLVAEM